MAFTFEQNGYARRDIFPIFQNLKSPKCDGIEKRVFLEFLENVQERDMKFEATRKIWEIKADMLVANFDLLHVSRTKQSAYRFYQICFLHHIGLQYLRTERFIQDKTASTAERILHLLF